MADGAASGASPDLLTLEKDALISALRQESERLLAEQAARLSKHFDEQLSSALAALTSTNEAALSSSQRARPSTVATPQRSQSHAVFQRFEEGAAVRPVTVHTSTGTAKKSKPKPAPKPVSRIPAHLVKRYLGTDGGTKRRIKQAFASEPLIRPLPSGAKDSLPALPVASAAPPLSDVDAALSEPVRPDDDAAMEAKFPSVARMMLRKGESLLRQIAPAAEKTRRYRYEWGRTKTAHLPHRAAERAAVGRGVDAILAACEPVYSPPRSLPRQQQVAEDAAGEEGLEEGEVHEDQAVLRTDEKGVASVVLVGRDSVERPVLGAAPPRPQPRRRREPPPVDGWHEQRVNDHDEQHLVAHNNTEWENQIAKHVLSLFASSKVHDDAVKAKVVMHYVDNKKSESMQTVLDALDEHNDMVSGKDSGMYKVSQSDDLFSGAAATAAQALSPASRLLGKKTGLVRNKRYLSLRFDEYVKPRVPTLTTVTGEPFEKVFAKYRSCNVIFLKDGTETALRGSPRVFPLWFITTGEVYTDWSHLPGGSKLQAQLNQMYDHQLFREYATVLGSILTRLWRDEGGSERADLRATVDMYMHKRHSDKPSSAALSRGRPRPTATRAAARPPSAAQVTFAESSAEGSADDGLFADSSVYTLGQPEPLSRTGFTQDQLRESWRRFVTTCNSVSLAAISRGEDVKALEMIQLTEGLIFKDGILPRAQRDELSAYLNNTWAYYFYRKRSVIPAGSFCHKALALHERTGDLEGLGTSLVHLAACYSLQARYKDAHRTIYHFLAMVEDGRMGLTSATPAQLCLVSIAYHNLAVLQLKMGVADLAAKSSQSARKIARLCLSHSSRYTHVLQYTHDACIDDINFRLASQANRLDAGKTKVVQELMQELYHHDNREVQSHRGWE